MSISDEKPHQSSLDQAQLLDRLALAERAPGELAAELGVSIVELAQIVMQPDPRKALERVIDLAALHRKLLLARLKLNAVAHLAAMAAGMDGNETARKACVDLLRADVISESRRPLPRPGKWTEPSPFDDPPPPADMQKAILDGLERLGAEWNNAPAPAPGPGPGSAPAPGANDGRQDSGRESSSEERDFQKTPSVGASTLPASPGSACSANADARGPP